MKPLTHPATIAFGIANLYLIDLTGPIIAPDHDLIYHLMGSASSVILPVIAYLLTLSLLFFALLLFPRRPGPLRVIIWSAFLLALPPLLLHTIANFAGAEVPEWITNTVASTCLLVLVAIAIFWKKVLPGFERAQPVAAITLGFFAYIGLFIFAQLCWSGWQARRLNPAPTLHQSQISSTQTHPRVIWLLLDELSYQQLYERRYPGLDLPAFDQLAAESTIFTHVIPAGEYTRYILPTLITGTPSNEINVSASGMLLSLRNPSTGRWTRFDQHQSVFQDALNSGYTTAIAGWYNPYCRILPQVLDHCFWSYRESTPANLSPNRSLAVSILRPFRSLWRDAKHLFGRGPGSPSEETRDLRQHTNDYRQLVTAGDADLADPTIDFLFLHMPIPHPYGFYDRKTKSFSRKHTSYLDNLALSDAYLAHLRQILEQQHQWDSTTLIVMGDHSWRTSLIWADAPGWTSEEQTASRGGEFDDRPAYIVKLPHQETAARIDQPWAAIHTRALMDVLLQQRIQTPADLEAWATLQK
ncbi:sulfatase-like hydrolase/transferase [Granulicella sp. S190]|uniref:sulfatase-like hydrolase/transferase n=1 Tax=Granulicella sp. S190 TaxID=1747226 RepID=UPI00131B09BB|nr:sulfatase-like hydrolase/transferase [Granulicella sp. S190]